MSLSGFSDSRESSSSSPDLGPDVATPFGFGVGVSIVVDCLGSFGVPQEAPGLKLRVSGSAAGAGALTLEDTASSVLSVAGASVVSATGASSVTLVDDSEGAETGSEEAGASVEEEESAGSSASGLSLASGVALGVSEALVALSPADSGLAATTSLRVSGSRIGRAFLFCGAGAGGLASGAAAGAGSGVSG